ncbi:uncharacterized protein YggE [Methanolinea mesophila]|uniref:SIMPL domain-containing protein n=1 Tax=Methanolinea mesophila TaxID=547055 RepID=UPI001AE2DEC9|nr:SIMPL domain-containing protein [Methanolinea mesophila]MBP1927652.1 uncharacterized protein YggE [Methanolinea mesophila]
MSYLTRKITLMAAVIMVLCALCFAPVTAQTGVSPDVKTISTSATGEVLATPDRADVYLGVQTENADVMTAQQENAQIMNKVVDAILATGVPKENIQTTGYSVYPVYDQSSNLFGQKVKYYQVTNTVQVTLTDVGMTGAVIDAAIAAGANQVQNIAFSLSPEKEQSLRNEVLTEAVTRTRADADAVAAALGVTIIGVQDATVGSYYPPVMYRSVNAGAADMSAAVPTPVEPGQVTVSATVSVNYLIN